MMKISLEMKMKNRKSYKKMITYLEKLTIKLWNKNLQKMKIKKKNNIKKKLHNNYLSQFLLVKQIEILLEKKIKFSKRSRQRRNLNAKRKKKRKPTLSNWQLKQLKRIKK